MTNDERIAKLAQEIYITRHNNKNDVSGDDLSDFLDQTVEWVNQFIPELEKKADWNFMRSNDANIGTVSAVGEMSFELPASVRKLVITPDRDLSVRFDNSVVSSFKLVNPNQIATVGDSSDLRDRATVIRRKVIMSRKFNDTEVSGTITADIISKIPKLSRTDVSLLDILDDDNNDDIRQLFILGVVKNQVLPDIIQGGLTPSFSQKFDAFLQDCIAENNASADADDQDRESFAWIGGVGF